MSRSDRAIGRCTRCERGVSMSADEARRNMWHVKTSCCGRWVALQPVQGTYSTRRCNGSCEFAHMSECVCSCGGANHGAGWELQAATAALFEFELEGSL